MTTKDPHHLLDRLVCLMDIDYFSLYDGKREQIEDVNRRLGELGYKHKLTVHAVMVDEGK